MKAFKINVRHKEFYPEGQWLRVAYSRESDNATEYEDELIYYYVDDDFDFSSLKAGDTISLDDDFEVLELGDWETLSDDDWNKASYIAGL